MTMETASPTPVSSMQDIINILRTQPGWTEQLRDIILGQELLALPAQFRAFEHRTEAAISELRTGQTELMQSQARLQNEVALLRGQSYEARAASRLPSLVRPQTGLSRVRVIKSIQSHESEALADALDDAYEQGQAEWEAIEDIRCADIIASARHGANRWGYVVAEVSITINAHDIQRASRRAQALQQATGKPATAVTIGTAIQDHDRARAAEAGVIVLIMNS